MGYAMDQFHTLDLALFLAGAFAAAFVTGLAGFAFAIVAAAVWLHFMAPAQATPLIIAFGLIVRASRYGSCAARSNGNASCRFWSAASSACRSALSCCAGRV